MNDQERAALVGRLSKRINDVVKLSVRNNSHIAGVMAHEFEKMLAERTPEPSEDAVERAAKALYGYDPKLILVVDERPRNASWEEISPDFQNDYRNMARAALTAAGAAPSMDALLDSVPNMEISETGKEGYYVHYGENQWFDATADVRVYKDDDRSPDAKYDVYTGAGPTRTAAIQAAVANAKKGAGQ